MKKSQLRKLIRESIKEILSEQNLPNPFAGNSGPNWQAAAAAWDNWNATTQGGAPQPPQQFLRNMEGKGCGFYQARLGAVLDSFVAQFGGALGGTTSSNPAWQSQKYAKIMWLAAKVQECSGQTTGAFGGSNISIVTCINDWISDSSNDAPLTNATCANGNPALSAQNIQNTKFRHQSISDCGELQNKIDVFADLILTTTGCNTVRKQAKHDYLTALHAHCCSGGGSVSGI